MSDVSWPEVIHAAIEHALDGVHTSIPAKVKNYFPLLQQVSVEPAIDGMPVLEDVPVLWPRGGGMLLHLPLTAGDFVLLTFCEADFSPWRLSGSAMAPAMLKRHGLYAYAQPGAAPDVAPLLTPSLLTGAALGEDSLSGTLVQVDSGRCVVGLPAGLHTPVIPVVTALEVNAIGAALVSILISAAGSVTPTGGGPAFVAALTAALAAWPSAVGSAVLGVTS